MSATIHSVPRRCQRLGPALVWLPAPAPVNNLYAAFLELWPTLARPTAIPTPTAGPPPSAPAPLWLWTTGCSDIDKRCNTTSGSSSLSGIVDVEWPATSPLPSQSTRKSFDRPQRYAVVPQAESATAYSFYYPVRQLPDHSVLCKKLCEYLAANPPAPLLDPAVASGDPARANAAALDSPGTYSHMKSSLSDELASLMEQEVSGNGRLVAVMTKRKFPMARALLSVFNAKQKTDPRGASFARALPGLLWVPFSQVTQAQPEYSACTNAYRIHTSLQRGIEE